MKTKLLGLTLLIFACNSSDDGVDDDVGPPPKETDCSIEMLIDASSMDAWIYLDLESQKIVTPANPDTSSDWDLGFQRFKVKSNGGISGRGGVEIAEVLTAACNDLLEAPDTGYEIDAPDGADTGDIPDYAMSFGPSSETGPWGYDEPTHQLFHSGSVFVVKTVEGNYFKLDFFEYYGPNGDAAQFTLHYKSVKAPEEVLPPGVIKVVTVRTGSTRVDIDNGVVMIADPATSTEWDIAASGPAWLSNGGKDRAGLGGVRIASSTDFDAIDSATTLGYQPDITMPHPEPPFTPFVGNPVLTNWFIYDPVNHTVDPKDEVYLIRSADGGYGKLRIVDYDEMTLTYQIKLEPVTRLVDIASDTIDATNPGTFTYYSLRLGDVVEVTDASDSMDWDLGLSRTRIRTNGGTSGPGEGGAAGPVAMPLSAITTVPVTFTPDAAIPDPENPGLDYSGNPVLAQWYDGTLTSTTPKDVAFVVRAADGTFSKVKITAWSDGSFSVDHAYAGPGEDTF